ncbi:glycosyltransferase [Vibrio sp. CB1-14]|uniref:Glycosyltransferase n=1 Tax=Vibrio chaetopteri TaxID=3016528 RepID=A0AAU8BL08_9VIBR
MNKEKSHENGGPNTELTTAIVLPEKETVLDVSFYQEYYQDLSEMTIEQLEKHWTDFGMKEGRLPNTECLLRDKGLPDSLNFNIEIDPDFYNDFYPDLSSSRRLSLIDCKLHWLRAGQKEGRLKNFQDWCENQHNEIRDIAVDLNPERIIAINKIDGVTVSYKDITNQLLGNTGYPFKISNLESENSSLYLAIGKAYKSTCKDLDHHKLRIILMASINYNFNNDAYEMLGDSFFECGDLYTAKCHYKYLTEHNAEPSLNIYRKLVSAYLNMDRLEPALEYLLEASIKCKDYSSLIDLFDNVTERYYLKICGKGYALANTELKDSYREEVYKLSKSIHDLHLAYYGCYSMPDLKEVNTKKVLIVGDYHIPQCVRYRIEQKKVQLEKVGVEVVCIDWQNTEKLHNLVALHDIVIFYRVPAVPQVLKAIAQVNAVGKMAVYEIDDLLFDIEYPAPIHTFGGYIDGETYHSLKQGMSSFYAAAKLCRFGIASTQPLAVKLKELVFGKQCIVHRNGLDSHNEIDPIQKNNANTLDIFYGSGTQAHNSDVIELLLPALERIFNKHSNVRLIICGNLNLPSDFLSKYQHAIKKIPSVKNVQGYYALLSSADINLAVLHDDELNNSKSELKWFEAGYFGIPSVVSGTQNYLDVVRDGIDGFIAASSAQWFEQLDNLICNSPLREKVGLAAKQRIEREYTIEHLGEKLANELKNLVPKEKTKKIKVALVNVFFPPQAIGGATRVVADNLAVLKKKYNDTVDVVAFTSDNHCTTPHQLMVYQEDGTRVYRTTIEYRVNMDWHPKDEVVKELFAEFLKLEKPDVIHFHCVQRLGASIIEAAKETSIPYVVTVHDAWWFSDHQFLVDQLGTVYPDGHPDPYNIPLLPEGISLTDSTSRKSYLLSLLRGAKSVLTVSERFAKICRNNGIPQIKLNKNGISSSINWAHKNTSHTPRVVCAHIGGMSDHKGYHLFKQAITSIQPENIEVLVVDGTLATGQERQESWGGIYVKFISYVPQNKIESLYQQIDVVFAPSIWPESYGLVTREAAACGCWVVASDLGGIGEDIIEGKTGLRIKPDLPSLANAVKTINMDTIKFKNKIVNTEPRLTDKQVDELVEIYK